MTFKHKILEPLNTLINLSACDVEIKLFIDNLQYADLCDEDT